MPRRSREIGVAASGQYIREGDIAYQAYRSLFQQQFGVKLIDEVPAHFLRLKARSVPISGVTWGDPEIARFLSGPCELEFRFRDDICVADVCADHADVDEQSYLLLQLAGGRWQRAQA